MSSPLAWRLHCFKRLVDLPQLLVGVVFVYQADVYFGLVFLAWITGRQEPAYKSTKFN